MSDEASTTAGLKRPREEEETPRLVLPNGSGNGGGFGGADGVPEMPSAELDDSDDEIGPMPDASSVEVSKGRKKKRAVLSHERVYLDNIPDTDRYTKSFMHRADLNFVTMTK
jgi:peptidylprolyl isomerase domain and WD repeat-containing protein 1